MRTCPTCHETFADRFAFCPTDGTPLEGVSAEPANGNGAVAAASGVVAAGGVGVAAAANSGVAAGTNGNGAHGTTIPVARIGGDTADGAKITAGGARARDEFGLTILQDAGLWNRLVMQTRTEAAEFRRDPRGYAGSLFEDFGAFLRRPAVMASFATAIVLLTGIIGAIIAYDRMRGDVARNNPNANLEYIGDVPDFNEIPNAQPTPEPGNAGAAKGTGGGQKPQFERPSGGGGGGRQEAAPASQGKLPQATLDPQVLAPDPKPPVIRNPSLPTAATIRADPTLFPPDLRPIPYGDPKSRSNVPSSGSGTGNGIGEGTGGGVGRGEGEGVGPGRGFNTGGGDGGVGGGGPGGGGGGAVDYNKTFRPSEVTRKVQILAKPEPGYTEEARKNNIQGSVTLRVVFASNGSVTSITPVKRLPDGLTEKAIAAAKQIKFVPAQKDGRNVSTYATINYGFSIY